MLIKNILNIKTCTVDFFYSAYKTFVRLKNRFNSKKCSFKNVWALLITIPIGRKITFNLTHTLQFKPIYDIHYCNFKGLKNTLGLSIFNKNQ